MRMFAPMPMGQNDIAIDSRELTGSAVCCWSLNLSSAGNGSNRAFR